jgi:hypothetical protein
VSRETIISGFCQGALRTLIVMGVAGLVITAVYLPVRWSGVAEKAIRLEEARRKLPPQYRERLELERKDRERARPLLVGVRMITNQFVAVAILALIGRTVLRLRLKR